MMKRTNRGHAQSLVVGAGSITYDCTISNDRIEDYIVHTLRVEDIVTAFAGSLALVPFLATSVAASTATLAPARVWRKTTGVRRSLMAEQVIRSCI